MVTKDRLDGHCFELVVVVGGRTVSINVGNFCLVHTTHVHRHFHSSGQSPSFGCRCSNVMSITGGTISYQFTVNLGTTFLSRFQTFNDNNTSTFTHDESSAISIEWARSSLGIIIKVSVHSLHSAESSKAQGSYGCFCTTCNHLISMPIDNHTHSFTNGMTSGSTGRNNTIVRSFTSTFNSDNTRCRVSQKCWNSKGRNLGSIRFLGKF
mmetsp:Transcript_23371/g.32745  ORF Transcript_23371/g.32745 Transcript_23371/m.32745 type:complete len:209 (-) Transcript_23371:585-1211(-)